MKIVIVIRVYNRIWDLLRNLEIINRTWKLYDYDIVVVANGSCKGFEVPDLSAYINCNLINLSTNSGHFLGNSQLLIEGVKKTNIDNYDYVILLEADTWVCGDKIIEKYINKLKACNAVWASAKWYDKFYSLATDFAIVDAAFLQNNIAIFDFAQNPECMVYNYLQDGGFNYVYVKENMPVMLPSYIKYFPYAPKGRFYVFLGSKTVTHHIEDYKDGKSVKLEHFSALERNDFCELMKIRLVKLATCFLLKRSWYRKVKRWTPEEE